MSAMKLLSATSIAALLVAGSAFAQDRMPPASGNAGGAMQKSEPAPGGATMDKGAVDKAAPKASEAPAKAPAQNAQAPAKSDAGKAGDAKMSNDTKAGDSKAGANSRVTDDSKSGQKANPDSKMSTDTKSGDTKSGTNAASSDAKSGTSSTVGSTSASGNLTVQQKTEIRSTVLTANAPRVTNVNFNISVGTVVPSSVRIVEVPTTIIRIHPEWRGYRYFVYNDEIIIVEPGSLKIIAVLNV